MGAFAHLVGHAAGKDKKVSAAAQLLQRQMQRQQELLLQQQQEELEEQQAAERKAQRKQSGTDWKTDPAKCMVSGDALHTATTRKPAEFFIEAHTIHGDVQDEGGDSFIVSIRGRGETVRAKVVDHKDGQYTVRYVPWVSGRYKISVTLKGQPLPGSPYNCVVNTPTPSAPHCILRGAALQTATARKEEYFEIQFKDSLGNTAHAEDLDVYVERVGESELAAFAAEAEAEREAEREAAAAELAPTSKKGEKEKKEVIREVVREEPKSPFHASTNSMRQPGADGFVPLLRTHECMVTSSKPLVVRSGVDMKSPRIGQLLPGQKLRLLEVVMVDEQNGEKSARASVAIVDDKDPAPDLPYRHTWRETFPFRPMWLDGVPTPRKQPKNPLVTGMASSPFGASRPLSPGPSPECSNEEPQPIGWVTVHKGTRELVTPRGRLHASERQRQMQQWARRQAIDKSIAVTATQKIMKNWHADMSEKNRYGHGLGYGGLGYGEVQTGRRKKMDGELWASRLGQSVYTNELECDPKRIGFAFGGVEPGRLHARGQAVESHKVYYSIAMCGTYKLHVGLRQGGMELPGSPFLLYVTAGPASALSTRLPEASLPLHGVVGSELGCSLVLQVSDKMGNLCTTGGSHVACYCSQKNTDKIVETSVEDNEDGTYLLEWKSNASGHFDAHVTIDGLDVIGSPTPMKLISATPDLAQTEVFGPGLTKTVAGKPTSFRINYKDQFGNPADPGTAIHLKMALLRAIETTDKNASKAEKTSIADRWKTAPPHAYESEHPDESYEIQYVATMAGNLELHLWCEHPGSSTRHALPNSPYLVHCAAGKAHAQRSGVEKFSRIEAVTHTKAMAAQAATKVPGAIISSQPRRSPERVRRGTYEESNEIFAGDTIVVKPKIRDRLGNNTAAPEGTLTVLLDTPDGSQLELKPTATMRSGLTNYEVKYEPQKTGIYQMNVLLKGSPIAGSPVEFECIPGWPDISMSSYVLPTDNPALQKDKTYAITVTTRDRCGNQVEQGGASVTGRLQSANLPPQQEPMLEVDDKEDGTYDLKLCLKAASELKVIIAVDKERVGEGGGEFPPIPMTFVNLETLKKKQAQQAKLLASQEQMFGGDDSILDSVIGQDSMGRSAQDSMGRSAQGSGGDLSPEASPKEKPIPAFGSGSKRRLFKGAAENVMQGFGNPEERREKVAGMAVVANMALEAKAESDAAVLNAKRSLGSSSQGSDTERGSGRKPAAFGSIGSMTGTSSYGSGGSESARKPALLKRGSTKKLV